MGAGVDRPTTYSIGPLTVYAVAEEVRRWHLKARPGAELVYATGPALGRNHETPKVARALANGGQAELCQRREGHGFAYIIRKVSPGATGGKGAAGLSSDSGSVAPSRPDPASPEGRLLSLIEGLAEDGHACPSNSQLADLASLRDRHDAAYRLTVLERAGLVAVGKDRKGNRTIKPKGTARV